MEYVQKSWIWIGISQRATQRTRIQLTTTDRAGVAVVSTTVWPLNDSVHKDVNSFTKCDLLCRRLFTVLCKGVVVEIKKGNHENKSQVDQVARQRSSKNFGELHHYFLMYMTMLSFHFIPGLNFILLCFKLIIIHYHSHKTKDKIEPQHICWTPWILLLLGPELWWSY